jgi:hypothetical protein
MDSVPFFGTHWGPAVILFTSFSNPHTMKNELIFQIVSFDRFKGGAIRRPR